MVFVMVIRVMVVVVVWFEMTLGICYMRTTLIMGILLASLLSPMLFFKVPNGFMLTFTMAQLWRLILRFSWIASLLRLNLLGNIGTISHIHQAMHFRFQHCFREANQVVDSLANLGCDQAANVEFLDFPSLPRHIQGSLLLDAHDTPYIRIS